MNEQEFRTSVEGWEEQLDEYTDSEIYSRFRTILEGYEPHTERDAKMLAMVNELEER